MDKVALRRNFLEQRQSLAEPVYQDLNRALGENLRQYLRAKQPRQIFAFTSFRREPDLLPYLLDFASDITIGLPVMEADRRMSFRRFVSPNDLVKNSLGILEPRLESSLLALDCDTVMLIPGLAYGEDGSRLGYGGGYYDALFAKNSNCLKIGVIFDLFVVSSLPQESHDCRVDELLTDCRQLTIADDAKN